MCSVQRPRESRVRNREELSRLSVSEISSDQDYYYNTILLLKTAISFDTFFFSETCYRYQNREYFQHSDQTHYWAFDKCSLTFLKAFTKIHTK